MNYKEMWEEILGGMEGDIIYLHNISLHHTGEEKARINGKIEGIKVIQKRMNDLEKTFQTT